MGYSTITKGYIVLQKSDGTFISKHTQEREALAILSRQPNGSYVIVYPNTECTVFNAPTPAPPASSFGQMEGSVPMTSYGGGVPGYVAVPPSLSPMQGSAALAVGASSDVFTVSAVIALYDVNMTLVGYGPSFVPSPYGVFYGRTDLKNGDKWRYDPFPGVTFVEQPGGWADITGPAGTYTFGWKLLHAFTGVIESGVATGIVLS